MTKNKKPTMNQVKTAINNLGQWIQNVEVSLNKLDFITNFYIRFKGDTEKYSKYLEKESKKKEKEEEAKNEKPLAKRSGNNKSTERMQKK